MMNSGGIGMPLGFPLGPTSVIQVTNLSSAVTSEQMRTLFGFLGDIEELRLYPQSKIPDEAKALSLLAPAPTMTSLMPGAGLLPIPTPTPLTTLSVSLGSLGQYQQHHWTLTLQHWEKYHSHQLWGMWIHPKLMKSGELSMLET
eukprot:XP_027303779.1 serine/arginine-rich splicing factor 11-like isoform X1 [Anas platyrhynchos]